MPILATWDETVSRQFNALPTLCVLSLNESALHDTAFLRYHSSFFFMETDKNYFFFMNVHGRVMSVIITLVNDKHKNLKENCLISYLFLCAPPPKN